MAASSQTPPLPSLTQGAADAAPAPVAALPQTQAKRLLYLDNLRILLICGVLVQHLSVTYGATGSWYYRDPVTDTLTGTVLMLWNGPAMAAGMGFFFLIAAYFIPGSYDRKGGKAYLRDRLIRLGIPMLAYVLFLDPVAEYIGGGLPGSYWSYYHHYLLGLRGVTGPVWFLAVLLVFTLLYAAWRELTRLTRGRLRVPDRLVRLPTYGAILAYILALGIVTFAVRIWWPVTVIFGPLNVSTGYLPQYASMFVLGLLAYRGNWFSTLTPRMAKDWSWTALGAYVVFVCLAIPIMASGAGRSGNDPGTAIAGGWHWQALLYAMWEPFILVGACIGLLVLFRERVHRQGRLAKEASTSAYTVYLIHPLVLVPFCYTFAAVALYPLLKFFVAVLLALPLCFLISSGVRRVPLLNTVV